MEKYWNKNQHGKGEEKFLDGLTYKVGSLQTALLPIFLN
jgi:hypothetical protein